MPRTTSTVGPTSRHGRSHRVSVLAATLAIGLGLVLTGCAEDAEPTDATSPSATVTPTETPTVTPTETPTDSGTSSAPAAQTIDITVSGDTVTPSGERVAAQAGEEIILHVTSDASGEIHVHSTPEQEFSYQAGTTDLPLTIDQPGLVDVESHTLDLVIVQLEVR